MELWDIYDENLMRTGRVHKRGEPLGKGEYHLAVNVYPVNSKGELLIQKRSRRLSWKPGIWAATGGSAVAGEDAFTACTRELMEELGIEASRENTSLVLVHKWGDKYMYVYLVYTDTDLEELNLQESEVEDVLWVSIEELKLRIERGEFHKYKYMEYLFEFLESHNSIPELKKKRA